MSSIFWHDTLNTVLRIFILFVNALLKFHLMLMNMHVVSTVFHPSFSCSWQYTQYNNVANETTNWSNINENAGNIIQTVTNLKSSFQFYTKNLIWSYPAYIRCRFSYICICLCVSEKNLLSIYVIIEDINVSLLNLFPVLEISYFDFMPL